MTITTLNQKLSETKTQTWVTALLQIVGGSLFIALSAQVKIPLFFTPVPISLQTLAVGLVAAFLGKKKGSLAVIAYLAEISLGLPFLAGGAINSLAIISPSGGYLIGMIAQAYLVGWYYERKMGRRFTRDFVYNAISGGVVIVSGSLWLSTFVGIDKVLMMGFYPFIAGDVIKSMVITRVMMAQHRLTLK